MPALLAYALLAGTAGSAAASAPHVIPFPEGGGTASAWSSRAPSPRVGVSADTSGGTTQSFVSAPSLTPPAVSISAAGDPSAGDILLTPFKRGTQGGPMIISPSGRLVWFLPLTYPQTGFNLEVQHYMSQPVLTFWEGTIFNGHGDGSGVVLNSSYQTLATVHAGNGYSADLHEFQITPQNTALIDAYVPARADLSALGGSTSGLVYDNVIQEIDIATGQVLWEWHSLGHIPFSDSYLPAPTSGRTYYDYLHLNSIQQMPDGDLLISGRNTWSVYLISKQTGDVIWTLGGKHSSFAMGPGTKFEWQHDVHLYGSQLTVFDDADAPPQESQSSAKVLAVNTQTMTASLAHSYHHSPSLLAGSEGSAQLLPDGNAFVGWGSEPYFSEYSPSGQQIFDGRFPLGVDSYRAYRFPWTGQPTAPPAAAASSSAGGATVYASWNGATRVATWCVLGGSSQATLKQLKCTPKAGFETAVRITSNPAWYAVRALGSAGHVLGTSAVQALS